MERPILISAFRSAEMRLSSHILQLSELETMPTTTMDKILSNWEPETMLLPQITSSKISRVYPAVGHKFKRLSQATRTEIWNKKILCYSEQRA